MMYKRKKKVSPKGSKARPKARMSHTKRRVKRKTKQVAKRRKVMAKKKSTAWDDEPVPADEEQDEASVAGEEEEAPQPEVTSTEATEEGVYKTGQACTIRGQHYDEGAEVALTPEELESVQAVGVKIYPV
jgi:hypothetical protein